MTNAYAQKNTHWDITRDVWLIMMIRICAFLFLWGFIASARVLAAGETDTTVDLAGEVEQLRVTTQALSELLITTEYSAPASVISLNDSGISAEIQGRAINIATEVGEQVRKGQLLLELDCRDYTNSKQQAMAALKLSRTQYDLARKQFTRNQQLLRRNVISRENFDQVESQLLTSEADIRLKQTSVDATDLAISRCKIYAPFSGQVTARSVQQGQLVTPGMQVFQLLQTDKLEIEADLSPVELAKAKASSHLLFTSAEISRQVRIRSVLSQLNSASNTQHVRLEAIGTDSAIISGLNGRLQWQDGTQKIPAEYLVRRKNTLGVMLEENGKAKFYAIEGAIEGQPATLSLTGNRQLIIVNRFSVEDGQRVRTD